MQIKIKSHSLTLAPAQEERIRQKVGKLSHFADRLSDESAEIRVEVEHEDSRDPTQAYVCLITLDVPQEVIRAEVRHESVENALDECLEKVRAQIERYKSKIHHLDQKRVRMKEVEPPAEEP